MDLRNLVAACVAWLVFAAVAMGQGAVRLARVPERVVLPAPAGTNLVVEAEVEASATEVWLAVAASAPEPVPLQAVGGGRFQLNLADQRVARLLPADRDAGELFVFAKDGAAVAKSPPIAWARAAAAGEVVCVVVGVDGRRQRFVPGDDPAAAPWLDVSVTERLEVHGLTAPQARVVAVADRADAPFARRAVDEPFALALHDELRRAFAAAGTLGVDARHGARSWWFGFRVAPATLDPIEPRFAVVQRHSGDVPGSRGYFSVRLGDITMGQVLLTVAAADGRDVLPQRSVGAGDFVELRLAGGDYVLVVDKLVNLLIGDDRAELRVVPKAGFRPDEIAQLIACIGAAEGVTFVREGVEHPPEAAVMFLRARRAQHEGELSTEAFVELASKSSRTGEAYHVKLASGDVVGAREWFDGQLAALRAAARAK